LKKCTILWAMFILLMIRCTNNFHSKLNVSCYLFTEFTYFYLFSVFIGCEGREWKGLEGRQRKREGETRGR